MDKDQAKSYGFISFVGVTMSMVANVRSIPTIAATGWQQICYLLFAVLCFALPVCFIAGEFGSSFPGNGGPQLWVKKGINSKWGFVIAWLLWAQMFPGLIMVTSTLGPLVGQIFGKPSLANNHWFMFICILVTTWIITILSFKFNIAKICGKYGVWIGVYIPVIVLIILGIFATIKIGLRPDGYLGPFSWHKVVPELTNIHTLTYFSAIIFLFTGIELTSVYIPQLKDYKKNYIKGVFFSLLLIVCLNIINGMMVSNIVPKGTIELSNISQPVLIYCEILHLPTWIANIFAFLVASGVVLQLSSWINGPCHTISQVAREGYLPAKWGFHKTNEFDISKNLLWTQIIIFTIFACLYAIAKNVNVMFITLTNAASILYMLVYIIMAIALLNLRKKAPNLERPFKIGGSKSKGNGMAWFVSVVLWLAILMVFISILVSNSIANIILVAIISIGLFIIPLIISKFKKPEWLEQVNKDLNKKSN